MVSSLLQKVNARVILLAISFLFSLSSFSQNSFFTLNGSAADYGNGEYLLTPAANRKVGSIWYNDKVSLKESFVLNFELYFGTKDNGADGMTFCLQPISTSIGVAGGGLGIQGVTPSFFAEFDTYKNSGDPSYDHIAIQKNGDVNNGSASNLAAAVQIKNGLNNVEDGKWYPMQIRWDASLKKFEVYVDCEFRIGYTGDIVNTIFGGNDMVYWGFTASTGGLNNEHKVRNITSTLVQIPDQTICSGSSTKISIPNTGNTFSWNTSDGVSSTSSLNPTLSPNNTTEYVITYFGFCSSEVKDTFVVNVEGIAVQLGNDTTICTGDNITLRASGGGTYLWSTGSTADNISVNSAGNYSVTVSSAHGCTATGVIIVTEKDCSCADNDKDGICDADDLDDDNDGILDTVECPNTYISTAFSTSGGNSTTFTVPGADGGFQFDIYDLDNSFNLIINGTKLVPIELQCQNSAWQTGQSKLVFTSDLSEFGVAGNDNIWTIKGDATNPTIRVVINPNGSVKFFGKRKTSAAIEPLNIRAGHAQANTITWNNVGTNQVEMTMIAFGPTSISGSGTGVKLCTQDTDGDGIPNYLDTDSDGDGCPDALEGGAAFKTTDLSGQVLAGAVDANGVPVIAGSSGQSVGTSANNAIQSAECGCKNDNDNDGICDEVDLDDDNDGILDVNECMTSNFQWSSAPTVSGKTATGKINGVDYTYTSSINIETTPGIFAYNTFPGSYNIPNTTVIKNRFVSNNKITFSQPVLNPTLMFSSIGGGNAVPIKFAQPVEVLFKSGPVTIDSPTQITGHEGYVVLRINGTFSEISFDYLADENYVNFTFGADFATFCDTDGDGTPDYLDGDSDGDGCPDAIEGGASFKLADLSANMLSGSVDTYGVPVVAGAAGQGVGSSTNAAVKDADCSMELISVDSIKICLGDIASIAASNISTTVQWSSSEPFTQVNDSNITASPSKTTTYYLSSFTKKQNALVNGDFESPNIGSGYQIVDASTVTGWSTTATDNKIEVWYKGFQGVPAYSGNQFIELNANMQSALYQDMATTPGSKLMWGFAHRGRSGTETVDFEVGPPGGPYVKVGSYSDAKTWGYYSGIYEVPAGQTTTRFYYSSKDPGSSGNFLDGIEFYTVQESKDSIHIIVNELPLVSLGKDTTLCENDSLLLDAANVGSTYLWNTGETTQKISAKTVGSYSVEVTSSNGCKANGALSLSIQPCVFEHIEPDTLYLCEGDSLEIKGKNMTTQVWGGTDAFTQLNDTTIKVSPSTNAYYFVGNSAGYTVGNNAIVNGDFEQGSTGFTSQYKDVTGKGMIRGGYAIDKNPNQYNGVFSSCGDHSSGAGKMFITDASETPNVAVWCQTVNTSGNTKYEFSAWVTSVYQPNPPILQFQVNGSLLGNVFNVGSTTCDWQKFAATWNSGSTTSAEICLINQNTAGSGNDFAIDDIVFAPVIAQPSSGDSVLVIVNEKPIFSIGKDTIICQGDSIQLGVMQEGKYHWNNGKQTAAILVSTAGNYVLEVENAKGCKGADSATVFVRDLPVINIGNDTIICRGNSINLTVHEAVKTFKWSTGASTQSIQVSESGKYSVEVKDEKGCSGSDSLNVQVNELPLVQLGIDQVICEWETLTLDAGNKGHSYLWNTGSTSQTLTVNSEGLYSVVVSDTIGCSGSDEIKVTVDLVPDPFRVKDYSFCEGSTANLYPSNYSADDQFYWIEGSGLQDTLKVKQAGLYNAVLVSYHCRDTFQVNLNQLDTPDVKIVDYSGQDHYCFAYENPILELEGEDAGIVELTWYPSEEITPIIRATTPGIHQVLANDGTCSSLVKIELIEYCEGQVWVPNAFSPDGDGKNDIWRPIESDVQQYLLFIYDRWGNLIFSSANPSEGWDGTSPRGNEMSEGVYVYQIQYDFLNVKGGTERKELTGTVTLVR